MKCSECDKEMGDYVGKRKTCSGACRAKRFRRIKNEKLANQESTKESRTDNSSVHGEAQPQS